MSLIFIQDIIVGTKLTRDWKVKDQIDTIETFWTKLKYGVKDRDQMCSLLKKKNFIQVEGSNIGQDMGFTLYHLLIFVILGNRILFPWFYAFSRVC